VNVTDYCVVAVYLGILLSLGFFFRKQHSKEDYFLGGRNLGWFPLSLSAMATQLGAVSFISAPAFVGFREGGGMLWLSYELGVPLAMLLLMVVIAPRLHSSGVVSVYEFIERRFGLSSRLTLSFVFQISRGFASAIGVYAAIIILKSVFGIPFWHSLIIIGSFTIIYSLIGGMKAVVFADALQMCLIVLGTIVCLGYALNELGGLSGFLAHLDKRRLVAINFCLSAFPAMNSVFSRWSSVDSCFTPPTTGAIKRKPSGYCPPGP
jgi:Na+/proline symporter